MAQRIITQLVSDITGDEIQDGGETIEFSYRGVDYTIDLTNEEAADFDTAIGSYLENASRVGGRRKAAGTARSSSSTSDYAPKDVRAWAKDNGIEVPARGRIPGDVVEQYRAAK